MTVDKATIENSLRVVRSASDEDLYIYLLSKFEKRIFSPWFAPTLFRNHYSLDIFSGITACGKLIKGTQTNKPFTLLGNCRECRVRYVTALERYIHEEIFARNPENPLEGFMSLNEKAVKLTENYSEKRLVSFLVKQILN